MGPYYFLWRGKNAKGQPETTKVRAESAQEARAILTEVGWTELELVQDEIGSVASTSVEAAEWMEEEPLSPEQEAEFFEGKNPGLLSQWLNALMGSWLSLLLLGALLAWGIYRDRWIPTTIGGVGLVFIVVLFPAIHFFYSSSSRHYARLNTAKVWGRWDEVLKCVEALRRAHRWTRLGVGNAELTRCQSQAKAGLGRLEEGVAEFQKLEGSPDLPHWLYLSQLSSIYDSAKSYEKSLELRQRAAEEKSDTSAVWIDLAYTLVRGLNRPAEAREALARAETLELSGLAKNYLPFLRGMISWREGNFSEAKPQLEEAIGNFQNQQPQNELLEGLILLSKAYLCAVTGAMGNKPGAQRLYRQVEKYLEANQETELITACKKNL